MASAAPVFHPVPLSPSQIFTTRTTALARTDPEDFVPTRKVDGQHILAPRYSHLSGLPRDYALATAELGIPESGQRVSNCNGMGAFHAIAEDHSVGLACMFACGESFGCVPCSKPEYRYKDWAYTRDEDRILAATQVGIKLRIPRSRLPWLGDGKRLRKLGKKLIRQLGGTSAILRYAIPDDDYVTLHMAMVIDGIDCALARMLWAEIAGEDAPIHFLYPDGATGRSARQLLKWVFSGWEHAITWPAMQQALMKKEIGRKHLVCTIGKHYRPLPPEEVKARHAAQRKEAAEEIARRKGVKMIYIPREHRIVEPVDNMEAQVDRIIWGPELERMNTYRYAAYTCKSSSGRASP